MIRPYKVVTIDEAQRLVEDGTTSQLTTAIARMPGKATVIKRLPLTRGEFEALTPREKTSYVKNGGTLQ